MSLTNYVPSRGRVYVRRFDHDEARERHAAGATIPELAAAYGVTDNAVRYVVTPGEHERVIEYLRGWRTGVCEVCRGPAMRLVGGKKESSPDGRCLCARCRSDARRERLLFGPDGRLIAVRCVHLDCANGERWQPPENFPAGQRHREVRPNGIHSDCRACGTRARQAYREKRKVPCETCGAPCLPPSEKTTSGSNRPRCRKCFHDQQNASRRPSVEAVPHHPSRPERRA